MFEERDSAWKLVKIVLNHDPRAVPEEERRTPYGGSPPNLRSMPASDAGTEVDEEGGVRTYRGPMARERLGEIRPRLCEPLPHPIGDTPHRRLSAWFLCDEVQRVERLGLRLCEERDVCGARLRGKSVKMRRACGMVDVRVVLEEERAGRVGRASARSAL
jgi:hypothetical protein